MGFIDEIKAKAKADKKTIVLPESMDKRTYDAAEKIVKEDIANIVIIGTPEEMFVPDKIYELFGVETEVTTNQATGRPNIIFRPADL